MHTVVRAPNVEDGEIIGMRVIQHGGREIGIGDHGEMIIKVEKIKAREEEKEKEKEKTNGGQRTNRQMQISGNAEIGNMNIYQAGNNKMMSLKMMSLKRPI